MKKVWLCLFLIIISTIFCTNLSFSEDSNEFSMIDRLEIIKEHNLNASKKAQENKITEMRNIIWTEINPELKKLSDEIENHIEIIKYLDLYNFLNINITHGDIKRGDKLFDRTKSDITYIINKPTDKNYINVIKDIEETINDLKEIAILIPEIEIEFKRENEQILFSNDKLDLFSINIKNTNTYTNFKKQDIQILNEYFNIFIDEVSYFVKNSDEHNKTQIVTSINQKIYATKNIEFVEIYEIYNENIQIKDIIYKTPHSKNSINNSALLHKGELLKDNSIISEVNLLTNYTEKTNHLYFKLPESIYIVKKDNISNSSISENNDSKIIEDSPSKENNFDEKTLKIEKEEEYTLEITVLILLIILFSILINMLNKVNKTVTKLENSRNQINKLKKEL